MLSCELQNLNVLNPYFLRNIDETSWKSLSGVRANECILQLVPNVEVICISILRITDDFGLCFNVGLFLMMYCLGNGTFPLFC